MTLFITECVELPVLIHLPTDVVEDFSWKKNLSLVLYTISNPFHVTGLFLYPLKTESVIPLVVFLIQTYKKFYLQRNFVILSVVNLKKSDYNRLNF